MALASSLDVVSRTTLTDSVHDAICSAISRHDVLPGDRLSIEGLASQLGVSPTPVREALVRLAAQGLASYESLVGYRVSEPLDADEYDRLMQARYVLEPELAALAAQRIDTDGAPTEADSADLLDLAEVAPDAISARVDASDSSSLRGERDAAFHRRIAELAGNEFLSDALEGLRAHLHLYRLHDPRSAVASTTAEHRAIVTAIRSGDPDIARSAMLAHLDGSYHRHAAGFAKGTAR